MQSEGHKYIRPYVGIWRACELPPLMLAILNSSTHIISITLRSLSFRFKCLVKNHQQHTALPRLRLIKSLVKEKPVLWTTQETQKDSMSIHLDFYISSFWQRWDIFSDHSVKRSVTYILVESMFHLYTPKHLYQNWHPFIHKISIVRGWVVETSP